VRDRDAGAHFSAAFAHTRLQQPNVECTRIPSSRPLLSLPTHCLSFGASDAYGAAGVGVYAGVGASGAASVRGAAVECRRRRTACTDAISGAERTLCRLQ
jgi:hypothetical protein